MSLAVLAVKLQFADPPKSQDESNKDVPPGFHEIMTDFQKKAKAAMLSALIGNLIFLARGERERERELEGKRDFRL